MRRVHDVLRLKAAGVGLNEIARRVRAAPSTVRLTLKRLRDGITRPYIRRLVNLAFRARS